MSATNKDQVITDEPLLSAAAGWFVRVQNDDLSAREIADWHQWLAANPAHREAFDRIQALWSDLGELPAKEAPPLESGSELSRPKWQWLSGLAATVAIAIGTTYLYRSDTLINLVQPSALSAVYTTQAGEHRTVKLPDGSTLSLGAESLAWTEFSRGQRVIALDRGEAFFEVAKDKQRPFIVKTGEATFTAVGTAFNVRKIGERVLMSVSEGTVLFESASDRAEQASGSAAPVSTEAIEPRGQHLHAGQQVVVEPTVVKVRDVPVEAVSAWRDGRLEYLGEPLKYVVADVNRYAKLPVIIEDAAIGDLLISGTVFERDIDAWLRSVEDILPVKIDRTQGDKVMIGAR